jgi:4-diphosphocytidyl-2C-methyl-D-erythritol kinase
MENAQMVFMKSRACSCGSRSRDELTIEPAEAFSFSCDKPGVPGDERNLAVRAVQLFAERTSAQRREIHIPGRGLQLRPSENG